MPRHANVANNASIAKLFEGLACALLLLKLIKLSHSAKKVVLIKTEIAGL